MRWRHGSTVRAGDRWPGHPVAGADHQQVTASRGTPVAARNAARDAARDAAPVSPSGPLQLPATDPPWCALLPLALHGQAVPDGTLVPQTWANPATIAGDGSLAFVAALLGSARNQGVFLADATGVRAIAIGSGGGGGSGQHGASGDPAPGGGTFGGFFGGTIGAPACDRDGNVLFLADVVGGPSGRALFAFAAGSGQILRVVARGEVAPGGGTFVELGPGVLGPSALGPAVGAGGASGGSGLGTVAFAARRSGRAAAELFWWRAGTLGVLAAVGDPLPGGGTIAALVTESLTYVDGSVVPTGPLPALDGAGGVALCIDGAGVAPASGILARRVLTDRTTESWLLRSGEAAPGGGAFLAFTAPVTNARGDVAVFADIALGATVTSGWFVGRPGSWRRALAFFDVVDGGTCLGLAVSRAPMTPLDDEGNLAVWCDLALLGGQDRIVECRVDGTRRVVVRRGDPIPAGPASGGGAGASTVGAIQAWPSRSPTGRTAVGLQVLGGTVLDGQFATVGCAPTVAASPHVCIGREVRIDVDVPRGDPFALAWSPLAADVPLPPWGTLRIGPDPILLLLGPTIGADADRPHTSRWPVPVDPTLVGATAHIQGLALAAQALLTNACSATFEPAVPP